ncbi:MAG TPA: hypothetical protein ENN12_04910 [Epsilonproteobacteria bacterium]|nr:hypothetical protein [Campylobacterota bacterium]
MSKIITISILGHRYEMTLDDTFADFIEQDLRSCDIYLNRDNRPDKLLKAYLRLAQIVQGIQSELERFEHQIDETIIK